MSTIESIYWFNNDQEAYTSSAPLLIAPVTIVDSRSRASHSNSAASFIHRRHPARSPPRNRRTPRTRAVAPISDAGHPFDSLPWISQMNNASDPSFFDIADLSQLPDTGESIGPVRRRKTSLRSSPLRRPSSSSSASSLSDDDAPPITLPPHFIERCTTPPPRIPRNDHSEIRFHNLMPQI